MILTAPGRLHGLPHRRTGRFGHVPRFQRRVGEGDHAWVPKNGPKTRQKMGKGPGLLMEIDGNWAIRVTFLRGSVNFQEH